MSRFQYSAYCNEKLLSQFPELETIDKYKSVFKYANMDNEHGANGIYEDAFCDHILELIKTKQDEFKIKRAFRLIEELVQHECFEVRCVAEVSFIERFVAELKPTKDVEKYLKPFSLRAAREIAQRWFGMNPSTWEVER